VTGSIQSICKHNKHIIFLLSLILRHGNPRTIKQDYYRLLLLSTTIDGKCDKANNQGSHKNM
jgi:hypothetical protein